MIKSYRFNLVLVFIMAFLILSCDGGASAKGKILDEQGKPIKDAKILLDVDNGLYKFEDKSKTDGSYNLGGTVAPKKLKTKLIVSKEGYQTSEELFESQIELQKEHNIILKK
jgi:hypothetical protein